MLGPPSRDAGHTWQDRDLLWLVHDQRDRIGARELRRLLADLLDLGGQLDVGKRLKGDGDLPDVLPEDDQVLGDVHDHLDVRAVEDAADRLLLLHELEVLDVDRDDGAVVGGPEIRVVECVLGGLK